MTSPRQRVQAVWLSSWSLLPLRGKFVLVTVAVLVTVLASFGSVLYADLEATLVDSIAASMESAAHTALAQQLHDAAPVVRVAIIDRPAGEPRSPFRLIVSSGWLFLPPVTTPTSTQLLCNLALALTSRDLSARALAPNGSPFQGVRAPPFPTVPAPVFPGSVYQQVAASRTRYHVRVDTSSGPVLVVLLPVIARARSGFQTIGVLQLDSSLQLADNLLSRLRVLLTIGTLLAVVATILLLIPVVRAVLRPLRRMAATSRAIAGGDLGQRVAVPAAGDELTDLALDFNEMVVRLETTLVAQRRFIADASHELRSPLTALAGGTEMLLLNADQADPGAKARLLRLMQGEIARMGRLVDDLLTLTRLDARGKDALAIAPVNLTLLAAQVVDETRLLAPELDVLLVEPDGAVVVPGDVDRLHQVLLNLCSNARAHTRPPGVITVTVRRDGPVARVSVEDTGTGIDPADLPHIWDRFYRSDLARERRSDKGGLGLGLAIVRAIVENHGGGVGITSELSKGTAVTVTLPSSAASAGRSAPATAGTPT